MILNIWQIFLLLHLYLSVERGISTRLREEMSGQWSLSLLVSTHHVSEQYQAHAAKAPPRDQYVLH